MSSAELTALLPRLNEISSDEILTRSPIPVHIMIGEAEKMAADLVADFPLFTLRGFDSATHGTLMAEAARAVASLEESWQLVRAETPEAKLVWDSNKKFLHDYREELFDCLEDIADDMNDAILQTQLSTIAKGHGYADIIEDLGILIELSRRNSDNLQIRGINTEYINKAEEVYKMCFEAFPKAKSEKALAGKKEQDLRNRGITHLVDLMTVARTKAKRFLKDYPDRKAAYISAYKSQLNKSNSKKPASNIAT